MKSLLTLAALTLAAAFCSAQSPTTLPAGGPAERNPRAPRFIGEYRGMAEAVDATAEQKAGIEEKLQACREAMRQWQLQNNQKVRELGEEIRQAREAGDKAKRKELSQQAKVLQQQREQLEGKLVADIESVLTPEQKQKWVVQQMQRRVSMMRRVELSSEQKSKVDELIQARAGEMAGVELPERRKMQADLMKQIREEVLTAEQRQKTGRHRASTQPASEPAES